MITKIDAIFQVSDDSWYVFDKTTGGITYRLQPKFTGIFNESVKKIANNAAKIAASYTPFQYFRNAWASNVTYAGRGMIGTILIYNKMADSRMPYRSQWADSGKTFYFPIKQAINMLEKGRKQGYQIPKIGSKRTRGLLVMGPPSKEGQDASFVKKAVTIHGGFFKHQPVTNATNYMKTELHNYFSNLHLLGIRSAVPSQNFEFKAGNYANIIRGSRLGRVFASGKSRTERFKESKM